MTNTTSIIDIFKFYLEYTDDPYLKSMKGLPADTLDSLLLDLVKRANLSCESEQLCITMDMRAFKNRVKGVFKAQVLEDEVGVLLQYGASKNVISEVTGTHQNKIVFRRKTMGSSSPGIGRHKKLDDGDQKFIIDCWNKFEGTKAVKLIRTHHYTNIPINEVWLVVKSLPNPSMNTQVAHVSQQNNSIVS